MTSSSKNLRVLVVDDDILLQKKHSKMCKQIGCEAKIAINGKDAVDLFQAGNKFDLVLMDMEMPIMDGPTSTKKLRDMGIDTIIVGVSSEDEESKKNAFKTAGLTEFHAKPLKMETLKAIVEKINKSD